MTAAICPSGPSPYPGFPIAGHIPEPPEATHKLTDLARTCAELAAEIDPAEAMRLSYPDTRLFCDDRMLTRALSSIFRYMLGRGLQWVCVDAVVTAPGWIGLTVNGDVGPLGQAPERLQPKVTATAREVLGLDDLDTPEQGFLGLQQRRGGLIVSVHMLGRLMPEDDSGAPESPFRRTASGEP